MHNSKRTNFTRAIPLLANGECVEVQAKNRPDLYVTVYGPWREMNGSEHTALVSWYAARSGTAAETANFLELVRVAQRLAADADRAHDRTGASRQRGIDPDDTGEPDESITARWAGSGMDAQALRDNGIRD